ncbi:MAG: hypothetical protein ACYS1A_15320 [Planctomycetota bacterium]
MPVQLTDEQADEFKKWAAAIPDTTTLVSPKATAVDGESADLSVTTQHEHIMSYKKPEGSSAKPEPVFEKFTTGVKLNVTPKMQRDGKTIILKIVFSKIDLVGVEKNLNESGNEIEIPVLNTAAIDTSIGVPNGKNTLVPVAGLFSAVNTDGLGKPIQQTLLLIKPTILSLTSGLQNEPAVEVEGEKNKYPFSVFGKVADQNGEPLAGVEIRANCGMGTLFRTGETTTDENGQYVLRFGPGILAIDENTKEQYAGLQAATIHVSKVGYYEENLCRHGGLFMDSKQPQTDNVWGADPDMVVLPHKPYKLDFVMVPAATIEGKLLNKSDKPITGKRFSITGNELYPSSSALANIETDEKGEFTVDNVPCKPFWFAMGHPRRGLRTELLNINSPRVYQVELLYDEPLQGEPSFRLLSVKRARSDQEPAVEVEGEGEKQSKSNAQLQFDIPISILLAKNRYLNPKILGKPVIKFSRENETVAATIDIEYASWPETKWKVQLDILDIQGKTLKSAEGTFKNSGMIETLPSVEKQQLKLEVGTWEELKDASQFIFSLESIWSRQSNPIAFDNKIPLLLQLSGSDSASSIELNSVRFEKDGDKVLAVCHAKYPSGPKTKWRLAVSVSNGDNTVLAQAHKDFENSGVIKGVAKWIENDMNISLDGFTSGLEPERYEITVKRIFEKQSPAVEVEGEKSSWVQLNDATDEVQAIDRVLKKWFDACRANDFERAKKVHLPEKAEQSFKEMERLLEIVPDEPFTILTVIGDDKAAHVAVGTQDGTVFFGEPVVIGLGLKEFDGQWRVVSAGGTRFERLQQFIKQSKENNPNIKIWLSDSYSKLASQTDTILKNKAEAFDKTTWNQLDGAPKEVQDIADVLRRWYKSCLAGNLEDFRALYTPNTQKKAEKQLKELQQFAIAALDWQFSPMVIGIGDSRADVTSHGFVLPFNIPEYSGDPVVIIVHLMKVDGQWVILSWSQDALRSSSYAHFKRKYPQGRIWYDKSIPDWLKPDQETNTDVTIGDIKSGLPETKTEETLAEKVRELNNDKAVFESYFPDSVEGGRVLDDWWKVKDKEQRSDEEILNIIRNGLRRTGDGKLRDHKDRFTGWVGQKYIWKKGPKNKKAVELMYYASFDPVLTANAVYYGLSVAGEEQSPKVLKRLVDICMSNIYVTRILWGTKSKHDGMIEYLEPYLNSLDQQIRQRAVILEKTFKGEIDYGRWEKEQHRKKRQQEFGDKLPAIRELLLNGNSKQRLETLDLIGRNTLHLLIDESFKQPLMACLKDNHPVVKEAAIGLFANVLDETDKADPEIFELMTQLSKDWDHKVRNETAKFVGGHWIWGAKPQKPEAIEIMLRLSKDKDRGVRYQAVYYGLSVVANKNEKVIERLIEMALDTTGPNDFGRISWGLSRGADEEIIKKYLTPYLTIESKKGELAGQLYRAVFD